MQKGARLLKEGRCDSIDQCKWEDTPEPPLSGNFFGFAAFSILNFSIFSSLSSLFKTLWKNFSPPLYLY